MDQLMSQGLLWMLFGVVLGGVILLLVLRLRPAGSDEASRQLATALSSLQQTQVEQTGRLSQLAETTGSQLAQVSRTLEERLEAVTRRVGLSLTETSTKTNETIVGLEKRLAVIDAAQEKFTELSRQVVGLQDVLSNKQARGAFGEVQLNDLVTSILPPSAYAFQATLSTGARVDCLLNLPNPPGPIAIDAKFPLESYRALREAGEDGVATLARRRFAADVRKHITDIAAKYIIAGETAESALMFLPSEAVYAELHANMPEVVEEGFRRRVWIVSPTTLMATLNTVRAILKDVRMREQAHVIQEEVRRFLVDLGRLSDRIGKLETHFDLAQRDLSQARTSANKLAASGERIDQLQLEDTSAQEALPGSGDPQLPLDSSASREPGGS